MSSKRRAPPPLVAINPGDIAAIVDAAGDGSGRLREIGVGELTGFVQERVRGEG
jgi:hypothetical protein